MPDEPRGFWTTIPGILTGLAALLTAIGGLALALGQSGVLKSGFAATNAVHPAAPAALADSAPAAVVASSSAVSAAEPPVSAAPSHPPSTNLLAADSGGHLVAASSDGWKMTIDGDEASYAYIDGEGVYAFSDEKAATFDTFGILIPSTSGTNIAEYELSAGDASPTGPFRVIGRFITQNIKLFGTPYQEAHFAPVTARFLRVRIIRGFASNNTVGYEFRLR
jgi:hypothetical protein